MHRDALGEVELTSSREIPQVQPGRRYFGHFDGNALSSLSRVEEQPSEIRSSSCHRRVNDTAESKKRQ